jgi:multiple sugar transport system ATP-binding protein
MGYGFVPGGCLAAGNGVTLAQIGFRNVSKIYDNGVAAVRAFDLEIEQGEFVVLVGPSGCGKSTILRLIAGLESVTSGEIEIAGRAVNNMEPKDRNVAMVFQSYALYPHMTVFDNMAFGLKMRRLPRTSIQGKVADAAEILGLEEVLGRKPKSLSGGQRQRVALGRAIVRDAACFLYDEPLSNLDARLRLEMRTEIKRLHARLRTTSIYVTHDQEEAMTMGDRVVVLKDGQMQQCGTPLEVYHRPRNRFVAGFVGTPQMNFFEGTLRSEGSVAAVEGNGWRLPITLSAASVPNGAPVTVGIRPQALFVNGAGNPANSLSGIVQVREWLGDKMNLHCATSAGHTFTAHIDACEHIQTGDQICFTVDQERIHLFEASGVGLSLMAHGLEMPRR